MPQQSDTRFTGAEFVFYADGQLCSNDWTEFNFSETADTVEKTAGNEQNKSYNFTTVGREFDFTVYDQGENADALTRKLRARKRVFMKCFSKGNITGKPVWSFWALIEKREMPYKRDDNVSIKISGKVDGALVDDIGSYATGN
jgi:hypothetical protein